MSTKWLAIQSFQYDRSLITAINTLSIQIKLELAGISGSEKIESGTTRMPHPLHKPDNWSTEKARQTLSSFLDILETLTNNSELAPVSPLTGKNQRLRQLAENFALARNNNSEFDSILFRETLSKTKSLLNSELKEDKEALLLCLQELRKLIEEHIYLDTETILGEV